jgi:PIN domain nuclease of toxin-antitoxin system
VTTVLLDTHAMHWWSSEPGRLSVAAAEAITNADELAIAAVSWFELAWLVQRNRITVALPARAWLERLASQIRTIDATPAIAVTAAELPRSFPPDPSDRVIYATAIEHGLQLVTRDEQMRQHPYPRQITVW